MCLTASHGFLKKLLLMLCAFVGGPQPSLRDIIQNMVCNTDAVIDIEDVTYVLSGLSMRATYRSEFALWSHYLEQLFFLAT